MKNSALNKSKAKNYFATDQLKSNLRNLAVRGAGAVISSRLITYFIQMIGTVILARLLTPRDFGLVAMVTVFSAILIEFGILRLADATIQKEEINHNQISTLLWLNVVLCAVIALIIIGLSPLIVWFYKEPKLKLIIFVIAGSFIFHGLSVQHLALLQRNMQFYRYASNQIVASLVSVVAAIALALNGYGYWAIVARQLVFIITISIGAWILCPWRPGWPKRKTGIGPMVKYGVNSLGSYMMGYVHRSLDKLLIGWQHGPISLGYYDRAYHLFVMPANQLVNPLASVAVSTLSKLKKEPDTYRNYFLKAVSMLAFIGMPVSAIMTLVGKDFVLLLLGSQWDMAGQILSVFSPGIGVMLIYGTIAWIHLSLGNADRLFRWSSFGAVIFALFLFTGVQFGTIGVTVAYIASYYVLTGPALWFAGKPIGIKFHHILSVIWKPYVSALIAGFLSWYLFGSANYLSHIFARQNTVARIFIATVTCISFYLFLTIVLNRGTKPISQFINMLNEMLPNIFKNSKSRDDHQNRNRKD